MHDESLDQLRRRSARLAQEDPTSEEALQAHAAVLRRDPKERRAANWLGRALIELGRHDDAERVFKDAVTADPGNEIAQRRLRELPRHAAAAAEARGLAPGREEWAEYAERDADEVRRLFDAGNENWRAFLTVLVAAAPSRLTYPAIEERLGWGRGRLRNVIGGTRSADGEAPRPYHICSPALSRSGEWEAWMDREQAAALQDRAGP